MMRFFVAFLFVVVCVSPPSPEKDTPEFRLQAYAANPYMKFCYRWEPWLWKRKILYKEYMDELWLKKSIRTIEKMFPKR